MNITNGLHNLITYICFGDFGLLTTVPYFLLKILFPIITSFYLLQLFLVETNLLNIFSSKIDKFLNKLGLSSITILPLLLGFGCVTVALGALQLVNNSKERRIAQILLCMFIPCSAQLVINTVLLFYTSRSYFIAYIIIIFSLFLILSYLLNFIFSYKSNTTQNLKNKTKYFFKFPKILPLIYKSLSKSFGFLIETTIPFALGNVIVSILYFLGYVKKLCIFTSPVFCDFLKLPPDSVTIFVLSIIKKDLGASSLLGLFTNGNFTEAQIFICTVMLTLFVPCFASMIILFKHEKKLIAISIWVLCIFNSLCVGKILSTLLLLP